MNVLLYPNRGIHSGFPRGRIQRNNFISKEQLPGRLSRFLWTKTKKIARYINEKSNSKSSEVIHKEDISSHLVFCGFVPKVHLNEKSAKPNLVEILLKCLFNVLVIVSYQEQMKHLPNSFIVSSCFDE